MNKEKVHRERRERLVVCTNKEKIQKKESEPETCKDSRLFPRWTSDEVTDVATGVTGGEHAAHFQ